MQKSGTWYAFDGERIGQGRENVKRALIDNPEMYRTIEMRIREKHDLLPDSAAAPAKSATGQKGGALARPGTEVSESSELVQGLLAALRERDVEPRVEGMTAWVDAAFLNEAGVPAVCFGPGDTAQAHTENEWIDVHEIRICAEVLETFARRLAV